MIQITRDGSIHQWVFWAVCIVLICISHIIKAVTGKQVGIKRWLRNECQDSSCCRLHDNNRTLARAKCVPSCSLRNRINGELNSRAGDRGSIKERIDLFKELGRALTRDIAVHCSFNATGASKDAEVTGDRVIDHIFVSTQVAILIVYGYRCDNWHTADNDRTSQSLIRLIRGSNVSGVLIELARSQNLN